MQLFYCTGIYIIKGGGRRAALFTNLLDRLTTGMIDIMIAYPTTVTQITDAMIATKRSPFHLILAQRRFIEQAFYSRKPSGPVKLSPGKNKSYALLIKIVEDLELKGQDARGTILCVRRMISALVANVNLFSRHLDGFHYMGWRRLNTRGDPSAGMRKTFVNMLVDLDDCNADIDDSAGISQVFNDIDGV